MEYIKKNLKKTCKIFLKVVLKEWNILKKIENCTE